MLKKSLIFSLLQNYGTTCIYLFSSIIIARLLTPEEIGLFSLSASLLAIGHALRDFGISNYIVQEKDLNSQKISVSIMLACIFSWTISIFIVISAPFLSIFYKDRNVQIILYWMAVNFFLLPFSSVSMAVLRRELLFDKLCYINIVAALLQTFVSIYLAYKGFSFYSLVYGTIANTVTTVLLSIYFSSIKPFFRGLRSEIKNVIIKCGGLSLSSIFYEIGTSYPEMAIGKLMNFSAVAYFSKALSVLQLIDKIVLNSLRPVLLPVYSSIIRNGGLANEMIVQIVDKTLIVTWPMLTLIGFHSKFIIGFLFGDQWANAALIVPVLCYAMAVKNIGSIISPVIVASGKIKIMVNYQFQVQIIKIILVTIFAFQGLWLLCLSIVLSEIVGLILLFVQIERISRNISLPLLKVVGKNLAISAFFYSLAVLNELYALFDNKAYNFVFCSFIFSIVWILAASLMEHPVIMIPIELFKKYKFNLKI